MNLAGLETLTPRIAAIVRQLAEGGTNALSATDAELSPGTETRVDARLCEPRALVTFSPLDAGAAAADVFLQQTERGFFVLGHVAGGEGRRIRYEIRKR